MSEPTGYEIGSGIVLCPKCCREFRKQQNSGLQPFHESIDPIFCGSFSCDWCGKNGKNN